MVSRYLLGEMTWPEVEALLQETDIVLLPVGSVEQHGPHLPLDTDAYDAYWICCRAAERLLEEGVRVAVAPPIYYGVSGHHMDFPGTVAVSPTTFAQYVFEVCASLAKHGFRRIVIINGHGGNNPALYMVAQRLKLELGVTAYVDLLGLARTVLAEVVEVKEGDVHAGEAETSTSLANRPELVRLDKAVTELPSFPNPFLRFGLGVEGDRIDYYTFRTREITRSGVIGDPSKASAEKGRRILEAYVQNLVEFIKQLHQRA